MNNIYKAPFLDTIVSILLEYPIKVLLFLSIFQYFSNAYRTLFILITTIIANFLAAIISYSYIYNKNIFIEKRILKQALIHIAGIILLYPPYIYFMFYYLENNTPFSQISIIVLSSYLIGYFIKIFATYYIWKK